MILGHAVTRFGTDREWGGTGAPGTPKSHGSPASAANGILEHANIRLWAPLDRVASLVWVTPNVHKIHHSRQRAETNSNYGNVLTIYDRLLGTFTSSDRAESVIYGLDEVDPTRIASFRGLVSMPFQSDRQSFLTQKSGSRREYLDNMHSS